MKDREWDKVRITVKKTRDNHWGSHHGLSRTKVLRSQQRKCQNLMVPGNESIDHL